MEARVGTGGWAYFAVGEDDPLAAYARAFSFVEVNATFYRLPRRETVATWRTRVPSAFLFAVRAPRVVTHEERLRPTPRALRALSRALGVCRLLGSPYLVLQTPRSLPIEGRRAADLDRLLSRADPGGVRWVLEPRAYAGGDLPQDLRRVEDDHDVIDCIDLSRQRPRRDADALYTRLFGEGEANVYQFTDDELRRVADRGKGHAPAIYAFHGVRMYKDAARLLTFRRTGRFPRVTSGVGLASLDEVLAEDAPFPATKADLLASQGWKIVDRSPTRRVRVAEPLSLLPDRTYASRQDVLKTLGAMDWPGPS